MSVTIRPATADDYLAQCGEEPPARVRAWAAEVDGRLIGVGGVCLPPGLPPVAFVDISEEARRYPVALHKTGLRFMSQVKHWGLKTVIATCDDESETANRWLVRLGFIDTGNVSDGRRIYKWSTS